MGEGSERIRDKKTNRQKKKKPLTRFDPTPQTRRPLIASRHMHRQPSGPLVSFGKLSDPQSTQNRLFVAKHGHG